MNFNDINIGDFIIIKNNDEIHPPFRGKEYKIIGKNNNAIFKFLIFIGKELPPVTIKLKNCTLYNNDPKYIGKDVAGINFNVIEKIIKKRGFEFL